VIPTTPKRWLLRSAVSGAGAGVAATLAMSAAMLALQRLGLMGRTPPRHIVEHLSKRLGLGRRLPSPASKVLSAVAHLGFGAAQGAIYAVAMKTPAALDREPASPALTTSIPFALTVWAASYAGWIPALGILPPPSRDRFGRPTSMVLSHLVYGAVLPFVLRRTPQPAEP
jgi:hypothetical protein